jgi:hypothetical protein
MSDFVDDPLDVTIALDLQTLEAGRRERELVRFGQWSGWWC